MDSQATGASDPSSSSSSSSPSEEEEQVLLVSSKSGAFGPKHVGAVFLDKKHRQTSILTSLPYDYIDDFSVCSAPDGFIISGGQNISYVRSYCVKRFSITDQLWTDLPDMIYACCNHGSICVSSRFFTVGGLSGPWGKTWYLVHMLDLDTLAWTNCQSLETGVFSPGIAAVDTDFLVLGGVINSTQICKYDSHTGKRKSCQAMPKSCKPYNRTALSGKKLFVLGNSAEVFMVYNVETDQWTELSCPVKPVCDSAMVFFNGRLLVTGGSATGTCKNTTVQTYDIENKKWWLENRKVPFPLLSGHAAIVAMVPHSLKSIPSADPSSPADPSPPAAPYPPLLLNHLADRDMYTTPIVIFSLALPLVLILCYLFLS